MISPLLCSRCKIHSEAAAKNHVLYVSRMYFGLDNLLEDWWLHGVMAALLNQSATRLRAWGRVALA